MVSHQGRIGAPSSAGKFWWIQDHRIELFALLNELVECLKAVAAFEPDTLEAVNLGVSAGPRNGGLAAVDAEHLGCSTDCRGGHRKAAGVAEQIEHAASAKVFGRRQPVLALIEIQARLLPRAQVNFVCQAVFADDDR